MMKNAIGIFMLFSIFDRLGVSIKQLQVGLFVKLERSSILRESDSMSFVKSKGV